MEEAMEEEREGAVEWDEEEEREGTMEWFEEECSGRVGMGRTREGRGEP